MIPVTAGEASSYSENLSFIDGILNPFGHLGISFKFTCLIASTIEGGGNISVMNQHAIDVSTS